MIRFLVLLLVSPAFAHDKKLDDYGCHSQFNRGEYHCHSGEFRNQIWKSKKKGRAEMDKHGSWDEDPKPREKAANQGMGASCAPMDARGKGRGRAWFGWRWNGLLCVGVRGSGCLGEDCRSLYKSRDLCEWGQYRCPTSAEYYKRLKKLCGKLDACCKRTVRLMQQNSTRQALDSACPTGMVHEKLKCETSLSWCAPPPNL